MNKALKILLFADGIVILAYGMFSPIYAIFVEEIGGDILAAGSAFGIFNIVMGISIYIFGILEEKFKKAKISIGIGYLVMAAGFLSYIFVDNTTKLFIVQIILGIGEAIVLPAYSGIFSKNVI